MGLGGGDDKVFQGTLLEKIILYFKRDGTRWRRERGSLGLLLPLYPSDSSDPSGRRKDSCSWQGLREEQKHGEG